jgi:hypothetical protein
VQLVAFGARARRDLERLWWLHMVDLEGRVGDAELLLEAARNISVATSNEASASARSQPVHSTIPPAIAVATKA